MSEENNGHKKMYEEKRDTLTIKKKDLWKAIGVIAVLLAVVAISAVIIGKTNITGGAVTDYAGEKVYLDFYVMSQCPYGTQVMDAIAPVLKKLGGAVDFEVNYISTDLGNGEFSSLHGEPETKGNIVQLCAAKYNPDKYMDMIVCQDKNAGAIPDNWEQCAIDNGLDVESIRACYEGDEGKELLSESIKKSEEANAMGSPTIFLNGEPYYGGRGESDFLNAICNAFEDEAPQACSEIPPPKKVLAVVLNDKRCAECDVSGIIASLESIFPGLQTIELDYSSEQGKMIYEEAGITYLPAILFDETVEEGEGYANVQPYLEEAGKYTNLRIGASFDPTKEICNNRIDDTGNGKTDCDDDGCVNSMECREEKENHLQVFIMSDCPYGRKAVEALKGVIDNFGDALDYEIHYIASEDGDGFRSLHGQYEVDEDIIQLCVKEHSPEEWFDYMYCRSTKGVRGIEWTECGNEAGVDIGAVQACFDGDEGKDLLREDIKIADGLGIGASPTWLANNKYAFGGIDSETVKSNFCSYNEGLEGCENTLSSDTGGVASGSC
ncbi:hypothetical protein KY345_02935 [Candidatus Woesearchaeota archaeon]|nr:hypothetical protein [Candidatus Woesearchaeota archaeon]